MTDQTPILDVFIGRHHDAWRLSVAQSSWCPGMLRDKLDDQLEAFPVTLPDLATLEQHMWTTDSPYSKRVAKDSGVELQAKGRSAVTMIVWLAGLLETRTPAKGERR